LKRKNTVNVTASKQSKRHQRGASTQSSQEEDDPRVKKHGYKWKLSIPRRVVSWFWRIRNARKTRQNRNHQRKRNRGETKKERFPDVVHCIIQLLARYKRNYDEVHSSAMGTDVPENEYEVEQILCNQDKYALVKWRIDPCPTWEPISSLQQEIIYYDESQGQVDLREYDAVLNVTR
jgi:hypothetical protein